MLYSLRSDNPSFQPIEFEPGFNVILAERTKEASKKDSRNGLGKSTLLELIHFCLGAQKGETLKKSQMDNWTFTLELDLAGEKFSVSRNTTNQNKIIISGNCSKWRIKPEIDEKTGRQVMSSRDWNEVLGNLFFGLRSSYDGYEYVPTFRSLISYFIRRNGQRGAFLEPIRQYKQQLTWDIEVNNMFLLGLGWEFASKWQILRDRINVIEIMKRETKSGILMDLLGSIGDLEAKKILLEVQVKSEEENLNNFRVHPQYGQIENEANQYTKSIHELVDQNVFDKRLMENYEASLSDEIDAKPEAVMRIYSEAGVIIQDSVKKKLDQVLVFHKQVVANRKEFLGSEIDRLKNEILRREERKQALTTKRSELMQILKRHGALEEYTQLQTKHQQTIAELKSTDARLEKLKQIEEGKSAIIIEQELLRKQANADMIERKVQKEKAVRLFNSNSESLYEVPGILSINVTKAGFKLEFKIERSPSTGVGNMKIFCYDLMLAQIWSEHTGSQIPLIHDSIIFDGVDERQKALAIELACKEAKKLGFQYICTMNSDAIPWGDFTSDFEFNQFVRRTLTDSSEEGGLLGIRF